MSQLVGWHFLDLRLINHPVNLTGDFLTADIEVDVDIYDSRQYTETEVVFELACDTLFFIV